MATVENLLQELPVKERSQITSVGKGPSKVELIFIDENPLFKPKTRPSGTFGPLPMRTGYDKILYGTGAAYLSGLTYGGIYGMIRGIQTAQVPVFRVRLNAMLNQSTRYGPWAANSLGVMTMGWSMLDNLFEAIRGTSDYGNHVAAAFTSGFLFKSTAGIRPALLTGSIAASFVGAYGLYERFNV